MNDNLAKKRIRRIIEIIIVIFIILLLITCCTSKYWGRIGYIYNDIDVNIDEDNIDKDIIVNKELSFYEDNYEMSLSDNDLKISYYYQKINPQEITCRTSDALIATCYVKGDYVVINPKQIGKVKVYVEALTNGKKYQGKTNLTIKESQRYIKLNNYKGSIDLNKNKKLYFTYSLVGLTGNVFVKVVDESIVKVTVKDGVVTVTGLKNGKTKIVVSLTYNGKTYEATYDVTVKNSNNKSNDSSLKNMEGIKDFKKDKYSYNLSVPFETQKYSLGVTTNSGKAKVKYYFNGKEVDNLNDLELNVGNNVVKVEVTAEDGSKTTYEVNIYREEQKSSLKLDSLSISKGKLIPNFDPNNLNYNVYVDSNTDTLDVFFNTHNDYSLKYNGKEVDSLKGLKLKEGNNKVEITVKDEYGNELTYTVNIVKDSPSNPKSDNNYLLDIESNLPLNEEFNKDKKNYSLTVPYEENLNLKGIEEDTNSKVTYKLNGEDIKDLDINGKLKNGSNKLEIVVESASGKTNTYNVDIFKVYRIVVLDNETYEFKADGISSYTIGYKIYEYLKENETIEIIDYDEKDISSNIDNYIGTMKVTKGGINLIPEVTMFGKKKLTIKYKDSYDEAIINFTNDNYFITSESKYEINTENGIGEKDIVINNNFFNNEPRIEKNNDGICLYDKLDPNIYICITGKDVIIEYLEGSSSIALKVKVTNSGEYNLNVKGFINDEEIANVDIAIVAVEKYLLIIEPNGGFLVEKDTNYSYEEKLEFYISSDEIVDLNNYDAYYVDKENCYYYHLKDFNTLNTGLGDSYLGKIISDLTNNLTLYAIYSEEDYSVDVEETKKLYLVLDEYENIFYSEEYNKKMIYPGIKGLFEIKASSSTLNESFITGITLEEESVCVEPGKCLNMSYKLPYDLTEYTILNKTDGKLSIKFTNPIPISSEEVKIPLEWKWVEIDDEVDTLIGNKASKEDLTYNLTISLDFTVKNSKCTLE